MLLFKKGLCDGIIIGMVAGIAVGIMIKPCLCKIENVMKKRLPEIKEDGEEFVKDMVEDVKKMGSEIKDVVEIESGIKGNTKESE